MMHTTAARALRRVVSWYLFSAFAIIVVFATGLLFATQSQETSRADERLRASAARLMDEYRANPYGGRLPGEVSVDSLSQLGPGDRAAYLLDSTGASVHGEPVSDWGAQFGRDAIRLGELARDMREGDKTYRVYAERFTGPDSAAYVALVVADRPEIEDQYVGLVVLFTAGAIVCLAAVVGIGVVITRRDLAAIARIPAVAIPAERPALESIRKEIRQLLARVDEALAESPPPNVETEKGPKST
jgi:hypothetical protein